MYYKITSGGYIVAIGTGNGGEPISAKEYQQIRNLILTKPTAEDGYDYRLTIGLEWERYELPQVDPAGEETTSE